MKITHPYHIIPLLDLTNLNSSDDVLAIDQLCQQAQTPHGTVAAVCIFPQFVLHTKNQLHKSPIKIASVVNFPEGKNQIIDTLPEITHLIKNGADEIDVVMPYSDYLAGKSSAVFNYLIACREACGIHITLKVILETGAIQDSKLITRAAEIAIDAGANFVKTSTGKITQGASLEAAQAILIAINNRLHERMVGIKLSGGIRQVEQAFDYINLISNTMGEEWLDSTRLRFGASQLLNEILLAK